MEVRQQPDDLIAYDFNLKEKIALDTLFKGDLIRRFIQSKRTHYVTSHILKPLESFQLGNVQANFMLDEAYLKGALDAFNEILAYSDAPRETEEQ